MVEPFEHKLGVLFILSKNNGLADPVAASSKALRQPTADITGEDANTRSASVQALANRAYSLRVIRYSKFDGIRLPRFDSSFLLIDLCELALKNYFTGFFPSIFCWVSFRLSMKSFSTWDSSVFVLSRYFSYSSSALNLA